MSNRETTEKQTVKNGEGRESSGQFAEGNPGGPGRPRGSQNRLGGEVKEGIVAAYHERGGVKWLRGLNDRLFVQLLTKVMPKEIAADVRARVSKEPGLSAVDLDALLDEQLKALEHSLQWEFEDDTDDELMDILEKAKAELRKREAAGKSGLKAAEKGAASVSETN